MKQNMHVKRMLVIMLSLMMAISLMGVFTVLSYADDETFEPKMMSSEETLLPGEGFGIDKFGWGDFYNDETQKWEGSSYVISGEPTISAESEDWYRLNDYDDGNGWYFEVNSNEYSIDKSATVSFNYCLTDEEGTITDPPETEREFTIDVNVVGTKYVLSLNIDSMYNKILPGDKVELSTYLEKGEYIPDDDYNDWQEVDTDDYSVDLDELDNYCYDEENPIMDDIQNKDGNSWDITAKVISNEDDGLKNGEAGYHAIANVDGMEVYSNEVWIQVNSEFYEIHFADDFERQGIQERELLAGNTIKAVCTGDAAEFEIWKRVYGSADTIMTSADGTVNFLGFDDCDWELFEKTEADDGNPECLTVRTDCDRDWPEYKRIYMKTNIHDNNNDEDNEFYSPVNVKINGYKMHFDGTNCDGDEEQGYDAIRVFLSSDAVEAEDPEVKVKGCIDGDLSADKYEMTYELGRYGDDDFVTEDDITGTIDGSGNYVLNKEDLQSLFEQYCDGEESCNLVVRARAMATGDDADNGIYSHGEFRIYIEKSTYTDIECDQSEYELLPGDGIDINKCIWGNFCNEDVIDHNRADYEIIDKPTVTSDEGNNWYDFVDYEEGDGWYFEVKHNEEYYGKTATISFKYHIVERNEDGEITHRSDITRNYSFEVEVVDHKYDFHLNIDSLYNKILPGETVSLSTSLERGHYDAENDEHIWEEITSDAVYTLNPLENYSFDDEDNEDQVTKIMNDPTEIGNNSWEISANAIDEGNGVRRGYARYYATATYDGEDIESDEVEFWIEPEFYQIHNKGDFNAGWTTHTRELLEGNTLNANLEDDNIDFEIWNKTYGSDPQLINKSDVRDLYIEDCDDWDFFEGDGDDENPTRKLEVVNKEDRDLPWEGNIFMNVDVDDDYCDGNPVPVKINGYKLQYEGLNTGDNDGEYEGVKVFLNSDAVGATPKVDVKAFVPEDELSANSYDMEYELGYYDDDGFHAEETTKGTTSQGRFSLNKNQLQTLYNEYKDGNGYCELVVQARAKADDNDNGIYASGEFYVQIEDQTDQSLNNISDEEVLLPGEGFGINKFDWGNFYNEEYPEWEGSSYVISGEPTIDANTDDWYNFEPYEENDGWYFEVNSDEDSIGKSATVSFKYYLTETDEDGNITNTSDIERKFTIRVNVVGTKYNLSLNIDSTYDDILPGETVELSTSLEKGVYIADEDRNDWQVIDADDYSLEELDNYCYVDEEERTPIMDAPTDKGKNSWEITSKVIDDGNRIINGEAGYYAIATVDDEEIRSNDVWIHVNSEFYEIHNKGELNEHKSMVKKLLVGEELKATYEEANSEFEIWKRQYNKPNALITDETVKYFGFDDWDGDFFHLSENANPEVLTVTNDWDMDLPWDGTIRMKANINGEDYDSPISIEVYEYGMSFDGLNNLGDADGIPNTIVYLSSDAVNSNPEVSVKANLLSADGIDDYSMTYNMSYFYHDSWETVEISGGSKELGKNENFTLSRNELYQLHVEDERLEDFNDETVIFVEAIAHKDNVEYARESFLVGIWGETYTHNEYTSITQIVPGEVINIPKTSAGYFANESIYGGDELYYTISGTPTVTDGGSWCTIEPDGNNWKLCATSEAANHLDSKITFSFNYTIEGYEDVLRTFTKEITVTDKKLKLDIISDGDHMLFGESRTITPSVTYTYFEGGQCKVKSHANINGITYNLADWGSELENNKYTSFAATDSKNNKWKITAKIISDFDKKPDGGSDYYKLTATANGLTAEEEFGMFVNDEYYAIEHSSKKNLELNVNASEADRKVKLSDFALYKHYINSNNKSISEKQQDYTVKYAYYNEKLFTEDNDVLTLKDIDELSADGIHSDAYPMETEIEFKTTTGRFLGYIDVNIISKEETPGGGGGSGGGGGGGGAEEETPAETTVTPGNQGGTVVADLGGDTKTTPVSGTDGVKTETTISNETAQEIIKAAEENKSKQISLDITTNNSSGKVTETEVTVPKTIVAAANDNSATVEIKTDISTMVLDSKTLKGIEKTSGTDLNIEQKMNPESTPEYAEYDINLTVVKANGQTQHISNIEGTATVFFPMPSGLKNTDPFALCITGIYVEPIPCARDGLFVRLTLTHFSTYAIMSGTDANSKLKASAQATTMGKLTLKSSGKKIKLSWKKGKGNTGNIVKYQVYRSTKKNFKKSLRTATTKKLTFTDSKKLKKGTKYYYKVRAQIKLNGKNYWSKWSSVKNVKCK